MKKTLLLAGALLALTAGVASAQGGVDLAWSDCILGTSQAARTFACTSNSGNNVMYASAVTGHQMDQLNGMASVMDLQTNQAALSQWFHMETGGCRAVALLANFDFTTASGACLDAWGGQAVGGVAYTAAQDNVPNRGRIKTVCAVNPPTSIDGTDEYYFVKVTILNSKTVGNGSCAGCQDGACIVLNSIQVTQPPGVGDYTIVNPLIQNFVTWQSGGSGVAGGCPAAVPTHSATWGSVKSLYR